MDTSSTNTTAQLICVVYNVWILESKFPSRLRANKFFPRLYVLHSLINIGQGNIECACNVTNNTLILKRKKCSNRCNILVLINKVLLYFSATTVLIVYVDIWKVITFWINKTEEEKSKLNWIYFCNAKRVTN